MDTFAEMLQAIQDDFNVGDESTLFSPTVIKRAINRSYRKCAALFPWPELMDAKTTTTVVSQYYYDYPQNWRSNSIWKLEVDDDRYGEDPDGSPLKFDDYLNWKRDNPDSTDKKWSNQERRYFFSPTPTIAGLSICIWGIKVPTALSADADTTLFSYSTPEFNEAVVLEAEGILKAKKDDEKVGEFKSAEAKQILTSSWTKIRQENSKYEKNMPFFEVQDFYGQGNSKDLRGRFDI